MELTKNIFFNTDKLIKNNTVKISYTGSFSVYAADGGADRTVSVDLSNTYLSWAEENFRLNGYYSGKQKFIRDDGIIKISRSIKELSYKIYECKERYLREKGEEITINKLSEELKVSKDEIIEAMESNVKPEYLENTFTNDDDSQNLYNTFSNNVDESEIAINNVMIRDVLSTLNERDKKIILLR